MQITLVQVEIEEAIRRFVTSQINVREGMRIDIDLKATRGAEGYQAFIDIVEDSAPVAVRLPAVTNSDVTENMVVATTETQTTPVQPEAPKPFKIGTRRKAAVVPSEDEPVAGVMTADTPDEVEEDTNDRAPVETLEAAPEQDEAAQVEVPATKPRSLFGGLARPTNS